jgi:ABC-2 type transport system permease protein
MSDPGPSAAPAAPLGFGNGVRLVASREFVERIRERSFLISTAVSALILLFVIVLPQLLGGDDKSRVIVSGQDAVAVAAAVHRQAQASGLDIVVVTSGDTESDRAKAYGGDVDALLDGSTVVARTQPDPALLAVLDAAYRQVAGAAALTAAGIDPGKVQKALDVPTLHVTTATVDDPQADQRKTIAFVATIVLYGQIVGYGFWVAVGVVEEKASRVVEVLLATVRPRVLLTGKIVGIGLLGLVQLLLLGVVAVTAGRLSGGLDLTGAAIGVLGVVVGWFLLGYSFYAGVFAASAARVSRQEEVQNVTTPVTMLLLVSFFAGIYASNEPDSTLTSVLSVVPPFSALVAPPRVAAGTMPGWQLLLSVGLMLVAVVVLVRVAARLYEGAVLRTGARVGLREAWRRG